MTSTRSRSRPPAPCANHAPLLHPALLARVRQLNLHYLQLLRVESRDVAGGNQLLQLPRPCRQALLQLSPAACERLCATPYPLYSMGFEDAHLWPAACASVRLGEGLSLMDHSPATAARRSFFELAMLHAWHVAVTCPVAARVVYAMAEATLQALSTVALPRVMLAAAMHCRLLAPRWATNPVFWLDLVCFARAGDERRLLHTHLLGCQLIAAELELADLPDDDTAGVARAAMSPRLRERKAKLALYVRSAREPASVTQLHEARSPCRSSTPRRSQ